MRLKKETALWKKLPPFLLCALLASCGNFFHSLANEGGGKNEEKRIVITFDKNGGDTEARPKIKYVQPDPVSGYARLNVDALPAPPARAGYDFTGWYTQASGGEQADFEKLFTESFTVYARWEESGAEQADIE